MRQLLYVGDPQQWVGKCLDEQHLGRLLQRGASEGEALQSVLIARAAGTARATDATRRAWEKYDALWS